MIPSHLFIWDSVRHVLWSDHGRNAAEVRHSRAHKLEISLLVLQKRFEIHCWRPGN